MTDDRPPRPDALAETSNVSLESGCHYCKVGLGEQTSIRVLIQTDSHYKWAHDECLKAEFRDWKEAHGVDVIPEYAPDWVREGRP